MTRTIDYTAIPDASFHTVQQLNALFRQVALVVNRKLDCAIGQVRQPVVVNGAPVEVGGVPVLLQTLTEARLYGSLNVNVKRLVNLQPGVEPQDAITVGQAKAILGVP